MASPIEEKTRDDEIFFVFGFRTRKWGGGGKVKGMRWIHLGFRDMRIETGCFFLR